jgi:hypothetical protein
METKDSKKYQEYIKMRNQVKGLVRKIKANMEKEIAKNAKKNPKKFWQYANSKRKTKSGISELKYKKENGEDNKTSTDKEKAEVLAIFFSSVFTNEPDGEIPNIEPITIEHDCLEIFFQEKEVMKLLQDLNVNKSPCPDGLHPKMLKELSEALVKPLTIIYNTSLSLGTVPDSWKEGNITALFKKGDKSNPGNYRPVSLSSVICKLMEILVRVIIVNHMIKNELFSITNNSGSYQADQQHCSY